jgi:hypothetical protein
MRRASDGHLQSRLARTTSTSSGTKPAAQPTKKPVRIVDFHGVPNLVTTDESTKLRREVRCEIGGRGKTASSQSVRQDILGNGGTSNARRARAQMTRTQKKKQASSWPRLTARARRQRTTRAAGRRGRAPSECAAGPASSQAAGTNARKRRRLNLKVLKSQGVGGETGKRHLPGRS